MNYEMVVLTSDRKFEGQPEDLWRTVCLAAWSCLRRLGSSFSQKSLPFTTWNLSPDTSWLWHVVQVKQCRWYTFPRTFMTNSVAGMSLAQTAHAPLVPYNLNQSKKNNRAIKSEIWSTKAYPITLALICSK